VQSKVILFTILLQNKSNYQARTVKAISTKEVYDIYIELCKKTQNTQLSYKRFNEIISELKTAGLISN
jgi:Cdc6-like AAA superfamily ATPase